MLRIYPTQQQQKHYKLLWSYSMSILINVLQILPLQIISTFPTSETLLRALHKPKTFTI